MELKDAFKNAMTYAAGIESWVKKWFSEFIGYDMEYTFPYDFAVADWFGEDNVRKTYEEVRKSWLDNYKAFTEVAMTLSMLSNANAQLKRQGIDKRDVFICLYADLFWQAKTDFYEKYTDNEEACNFFFQMTD